VICVDRWIAVGTYWGERSVTWGQRRQVPTPRGDDVVVLDSLPTHKAREVERW